MAMGVSDVKAAAAALLVPSEEVGEGSQVESAGASPAKPTTDSKEVASDAQDSQYFFEDEIFRIDSRGRVLFGLVVETSDSYSGDEDDDMDDALEKGEVRVAWYPSGSEDVHMEKSIGLADRTLMPGDVVRRMDFSKDSQRGYCREINMRADVKVLNTEYVITNVASERLGWISYWQRDSAVCLDSWVGSIKDFEEKAVLRSTNGARIELSSNDFYIFKDRDSRTTGGIYNAQIFYPGNVVVGRLSTMENVKLLTPDKPLMTSKKGKPLTERFTVESVTTDCVWVHWQCKALSEEGELHSNELEQPNSCVNGEDLKRLKRLNLFESCMLQINDRNYLRYSEFDNVITKSEWDKNQVCKFAPIFYEQQKEENQNLCVCTVGGSANGSHHFEKSKKKQSILDCDKSTKHKKLSHKEKLNSSSNKDKPQSQETAKEDPAKSNEPSDADPDWISDDEAAEAVVGEGAKVTENSASSASPKLAHLPSAHGSPLHGKRRLRKMPLKKYRRPICAFPPAIWHHKPGDEVVVEALLVYSTATVVWQNGTIEENIPSTSLYPIHHLDNHEFFPGDFVVADQTEVSYRDYGVVQKVDHQGRTAHIKWFTTYTSVDEPSPTYKGQSEVSVYNLKDHPDFQYRPGTMVIRVANFVGEDASATAGQIIDNYIEGRVKVWWVDGHISMSWPQDLFEVGQYDHGDWGHESEESWETESENSEVGSPCTPFLQSADTHIMTNMERSRKAITRLEEILSQSQNLQTGEVLKKLMMIYKGCRYLDRLINTSYFHEDNFNGIIERVRRCGTQAITERAIERKNRLFGDIQISPSAKHPHSANQLCQYQAILALNVAQKSHDTTSNSTTKKYAPKVLLNLSSTPFKGSTSNTSLGCDNGNTSQSLNPFKKRSSLNLAKPELCDGCGSLLENCTGSSDSKQCSNLKQSQPTAATAAPAEEKVVATGKDDSYTLEKEELLNMALENIENAVFKKNQFKSNLSSQDDSGNYSRNETNCDGSSNSNASIISSSDLTNVDANNSIGKASDDMKSTSACSIEFPSDLCCDIDCLQLCTILKNQLNKYITEIRTKYLKGDNLNLSKITDSTNESAGEIAADSAEAGDKNKTEEESPPDKEEPNEAETPKNDESHSEDPVTVVLAAAESVNDVDFFEVLPVAPKSHRFVSTSFHPNNPQKYYKAVHREHIMLKTSLPPGVWIKVYEERMDLLSVMIKGPKNTPYEDGLFLFDMQLGREYPKVPPVCHYISYCSDRLNPNLYEDGKVCVSLLGTWSGRDTEIWGPSSTLLQVIVSIQGLILVAEPYYNEAGYEKQKGSQQGRENSRMYNEMVIIKLVQATIKLLTKSPEVFRDEILEHFKLNGYAMYERIKEWLELSTSMQNVQAGTQLEPSVKTEQDVASCSTAATNPPEFPLVPASRGFCLTLVGLLDTFKSKLDELHTTVREEQP